jgi:ribosome biogenesis GTPase / thiamine phosphate phosphatase
MLRTASSWGGGSGVVCRARGSHILERYGWDSFFRDRFTPFSEEGLVAGRVIGEVGPFFRVVTERGERTAEVSGRLRHLAASRAELPAVGDWVALRADWGAHRVSIFSVLPRRTALTRKAAGQVVEAQVVGANVDTVFLVSGLDLDFNVRRIERAVLLARESGAEPVIVLSKADLCDHPAARARAAEKVAPGVAVVTVSATAGAGLEQLSPWLRPGKTVVLFGSSGVGKSTIVNALLGEERQSTRAVREHDHRGKHTTTQREIVVLPSGALLIDTPGVRELGMIGGEEALGEAFADVEALVAECAFGDCTHRSEPRCAVKAALASGALDPERLASYLKLKDEVVASQRRGPRSRRR